MNGTITSPGYPNGYDNNVSISWLIYGPRGIAITFTSFDLEPRLPDNTCK